MEWWNQFVTWLTSSETRPVLFTAAVIFISILVAAFIAASLTKTAVRRLVGQRDRELRASAIAALVDASTEAAVWNSLTPGEQVLADRAVGQADIYVRLLPIKGASLAANWAAHQLSEMKRQSATFGYELGSVKTEFRDRLIDWQNRPARAKKIFEGDLARWQFETTDSDKALVAEQDAWASRQHHEKFVAVHKEPATETRSTPEAPVVSATPAETTPAETTRDETTRDEPTIEAHVPGRPSSTAPDRETQKLIDDVAAMEVRAPAPADKSARDAG